MAVVIRYYAAVTFLIALFTLNTCGALPNYIPNLRRGNEDRDALIEDYFGLGFSYSELLSSLLVYDGIRLSLRHLKRILKKRGLRRRNIQSNVERVIDAVEHELQWSGSTIGYRQMHQRMLSEHGVVIDRETVRRIIKGLDPEGVQMR